MTDTDRTEFPLASHGTPIPMDLDLDSIPDGVWDADELEGDGKEDAPFKKGFPFMFDLSLLKSYAEEVERLQSWLAGFGIDVVVDEVALLVPDANMAGVYVFDAVLTEGVEHFNASEDLVQVQPFGNEYRVRYDFLRIEGYPFRLEVMHMTDGISPVHAPIYQQVWTNNAPSAVHLSFKCKDEASYHQMCDRLERIARMQQVQSCSSSYGEFSYWRTDFTDLYVKPRFNRRDS